MSGIRKGDVPRLTQKFRQLPEEIQRELQQQIRDAGPRVVNEARARVPVDLGDLKSSITLVPKGKFGWAIDVLARARRGRHRFNYGWFVEFGTSRAVKATVGRGRSRSVKLLGKNAQPFLLPAFRRVMRPVLRNIRAAIKGAVRKRSVRG